MRPLQHLHPILEYRKLPHHSAPPDMHMIPYLRRLNHAIRADKRVLPDLERVVPRAAHGHLQRRPQYRPRAYEAVPANRHRDARRRGMRGGFGRGSVFGDAAAGADEIAPDADVGLDYGAAA